ncbi:nucleotide exchange factor GrpE [Methylobacterium sp. E-045]|jgi:molecular chaperone GrpE|uniref:nucleotide exchange factor GrpE n=1 Tax=Methylobacterium sp. E-045 TaxID=2836575 RepID=UPI001FB933DD|nr:nucleotide exchange factor GrpE [Methylobacterium sp. E-045]MCJ2130575.1 nucleotide exchange factor GrpE [Methylobacterium sp. E-045]
MMANDMEHDGQRAETATETDVKPEARAEDNAVALASLITERDELKDRVLRTLAEMENLRRRTEREVADARTYAVTNFARDMLNAADNIRRALESVPAEAASTAEGPLKALIDGIELTERDLAKTLERHGVKLIEPQGQRFDPNRHQAMFEVPNAEVPNGTVVQVMQSGYVIGDRVLRPALVGVAKGGPKAATNPADAA